MVDPTHVDVSKALSGSCAFSDEHLPDVLPAEPFGMLTQWLAMAGELRVQPNPNAMTLATVGADGSPSARVVLARRIDAGLGYVVFFTNYASEKGLQMAQNARVALCMHWDNLDRQARIEGVATRSPTAESDAYFNSRPVPSRIAAWASEQSRPIASRGALLEQNARAEARFGDAAGASASGGVQVPRPGHWGGFRVWASRVELWRGHSNRLHDRARWERTLTPAQVDGVAGFEGSAWSATRLQP
jgi:pyridoxamine 5'-phosphate oxidase